MMPAATLSVPRACVAARTPARLLQCRLAPSPGRIVVCISCEPEDARKPSELAEDWVYEDESGSDVEGERGGRNVVKDLAKDNSFIGVLVVALGAGLVSSANSLLSAFGVEPPRRRRRRVKGVSLPGRQKAMKVIKLTDRPIPKLEVPSDSGSWGPVAVSRPGGRSGKDPALIQPSTAETDFGSTMKVSVGSSSDDDFPQPAGSASASAQPGFGVPDISTVSSAIASADSVSDTLDAGASDPSPSGLGGIGDSITGAAFSQPVSLGQQTRPGGRGGDRLNAVDVGKLSNAGLTSDLSESVAADADSAAAYVAGAAADAASTAADADSAAASSIGAGAVSGRPGGRGGDRGNAMDVGVSSGAGAGTGSSVGAGMSGSAAGASSSMSAASTGAASEDAILSTAAPTAEDKAASTGNEAPSDPSFTPAGSVGGASAIPTAASASGAGTTGGSVGSTAGAGTTGGSVGSTAGGSASGESGQDSGELMTPETASQLAKPATTWPALDASAAVGGGREKYTAVTSSAPTPFISAADSAGGGTGMGGGKDMGGGGGGGGSSGGGGGSGGDGIEDDGMRARFPWVPVLLFLAAAATYPVFRMRMGGEAQGAAQAQHFQEAVESFKAWIAAGVAAGMSKASNASSTAKAGAVDMMKATKQSLEDLRQRAEELVAPVFQREARKQPSKAEAAKAAKAAQEKEKAKAEEAKAAAAAAAAAAAGGGAGGGASSTQVLPALSQFTGAKPSKTTTTATTTGGAQKGNKGGAGWLWYPLILAALGAAAYVVYKNTAADEGASAAATGAAAAGLARSTSRGGNSKGASSSHYQEPGPREVSNEVDELYAKFQQRDLQFAELSKNLANIEQQESKLRQDSAADVEAVRQQINEMRQSLNNSRSDA